MKKILSSIFATLLLCNLVLAQDSPLQIISKPRPDLPRDYGNLDAQGVLRLRVTFDASGIISKVVLISGFTNDLNALALEAAKKIKFTPAIKDDQPITTSKIIEYEYSPHVGWINDFLKDEKAEAIIKRAVEKMGGEKYLQAKSMVSTGNYTQLVEGQMQSFSSFTDALVFPDKERTEFKQNGMKTVQTNAGASGWLFDGAARMIKEQSKTQIEDFQRGTRSSLDNLLRGEWRKTAGAQISYAGRRQAGVGRRNDVVKLTYPDGFAVEYEFTDEGFPAKAIYKRTGVDTGAELKEEDRYGQFVESQGIYTPFVIDHYINDKQSSRINYISIEFNKNIPDSVFTKPGDIKALKKDLKF